MSYSLPPCNEVLAKCPYGQTSSFSEHCGEIKKMHGTSCGTYTCSLYEEANVKCLSMNDGLDGLEANGFNGCVHIPVALDAPVTLKRGNFRRFMILPGTPDHNWGNPGTKTQVCVLEKPLSSSLVSTHEIPMH